MSVVAVDTGGTFTDVILDTGRGLELHKLLSTPADPSRAVCDGIAAVAGREPPADVIHGSTVATNALLERRGARTALITTAGFEDLLLIGRQQRPELYNLFTNRPPPLVPRNRVYGVVERVGPTGEVEVPLGRDALDGLEDWLGHHKATSVAVCLLHAYANPEHEERVGEVIAACGLPVSLSSRVHREFREVERASTTVVNAYVMPLMASYLGRLDRELPKARLHVMQSNGGRLRAEQAQAEPVHTVLSGPAGGVVGAHAVAAAAGYPRIVSFDMGGTSTDVALCDGAVPMSTGRQVAGLTVGVPMIDIHTVGAGGGSLAAVDPAGGLQVGPASAGADPGPVCYGKGAGIAVTDAHVALGRLDPARFLGGRMRLHPERIATPLATLARRAGIAPQRAAEGIVAVANANMERAIRVISVERGHDPRDFALVAFGGAGGLHACDLARALEFAAILVPRNPGLLSAFGMLCADSVKDVSRTILVPYDRFTPALRKRVYAPLEREAKRAMRVEGFAEGTFALERLLDLRYVGQAYELTVPDARGPAGAFHALHERRYGHADPRRPVEVVTVRVRVRGKAKPPRLRPLARGDRARVARVAEQPMVFDGRTRRGAVYERDALGAGARVKGPAIIVEMSATTVVPPDFACRVDPLGNLLLERR